MSHIKYVGTSNFRELDAADLKKAGVESFSKKSFPRDKPVEVDDEVATALVDNESGLFDSEFEEASDEEVENEELQRSPRKKAASQTMTASGSSQESIAATPTTTTGSTRKTAAPSRTGNASSTTGDS